MARFAAFIDACVFVPITPSDTLLRLADSGAFRPLWSQRVVDEAIRALGRIHPDIDPSRFHSRFHSMNEAFDDALVSGWEPLEPDIELPDANDRHVVAGALRGRADVLVTENVKDFPDSTLRPLGLEPIRLDEFLLDQFDLNPAATCRVINEQAAAMTRPPATGETILARLSRSGAPRFARVVGQKLEQDAPGTGTGTGH